MKLAFGLAATLYFLSTFSSYAIDLAASPDAESVQSVRLDSGEYLSATNTFVNLDADLLPLPFHIAWFLTRTASHDCASLGFSPDSPDTTLVGFDYQAGLQNQAIAWIDQVALKPLVSPGRYCLSASADFTHQVPENTKLNNHYTFKEPLCYGIDCATSKTSSESLLIYPNPATSSITVGIPTEYQNSGTRIQVIDLSGRVVIHQPVKQAFPRAVLSIESLPSGRYVVVLSQTGKNQPKVGHLVKINP